MTHDVFDEHFTAVRRKLATLLAAIEAPQVVEQVRATAEALLSEQTISTISAATALPDLFDTARHTAELLQRDFAPKQPGSIDRDLLERVARLAVVVPGIVARTADLERVEGWLLGGDDDVELNRLQQRVLARHIPEYLRLDWKHRVVTSCLLSYLEWSSPDWPAALRNEAIEVCAHLDLSLPAQGCAPRFLLAPPPAAAVLTTLLGAVSLGQHQPGDDVGVILALAADLWTPTGIDDRSIIATARALAVSSH